jgi:transcriptional regulator with XRE-family HTH domain
VSRDERFANFLKAHGILPIRLAADSGLTETSIRNLINGATTPRVGTINRLLPALRAYDPTVTFESLWGVVATERVA